MNDLYDSGIRPELDKYFLSLAEKVRDYGDYWSASSAGYCQRKVLFERLKVPYVPKEDVDESRRQRVFAVGHLFHEFYQNLTKELGLSVIQEAELQDEDLMVRGHIDDLVMKNGHLILYDYKTVNSQQFKYRKDKISYYHRMQLGTYLYMLRRKTDFGAVDPNLPKVQPLFKDLSEARIMNISKDDHRQAEMAVIWNDMLENDVKNYWKELNKHWEKKTFPECTCDEEENGFMAKEKWNPYFYEDEPCSMDWYNKCKEEGLIK
jgi:hypothetical protein